ncbi:hypothetical protein [Ramlibacter sp.]|uniref:hypothetical protein n=1 Tax=Ramlibacter sp. TaxID=1917967 RepID=UPI003D0E29E3
MNELLGNPAVQSAAAPFVVALAVAAILARTRFLGLAQVAGFAVLAALAIGFSFESLSSTMRLALVGLASAVIVLAVEYAASIRVRYAAGLVVPIAFVATLWVLWRFLGQKELATAVLQGAAAAAFVAYIAASTLWIGQDPVRGASTGLMLGVGTGALAVLGASAVLGLAAISVGAAAGATLLIQMIRGQPSPVGASISLPAAMVAGLAGVLAAFSASLPWYCLLPVLLTPILPRWVPDAGRPVWLRAVLNSLAALAPMLIAIFLAWRAATSSS